MMSAQCKASIAPYTNDSIDFQVTVSDAICFRKDVNMDCVHIGSKSGSTIKSLDIDTAILNPTQPSDKSSM